MMPRPESLTPMLVAELVGGIYEAALDPLLWRPLVERIEAIYPELTIMLFSHESGAADELSVVLNYPDAALRDYAAYYFTNSPFVDFVPRNQVGLATRSETIISKAELFRTEHYNDFMRPHRLGLHGCGMVLERAPEGWASLSFSDQKDDADRRAHQMALLGLLAPHFARALKLRRAMIAARTPGIAQQAVFDGWAHAAFVLDAEGRVATMNRRAQALVARGDGITLNRTGQPRSLDDRCSRALDTAVAHCRLHLADSALNGVMLPRHDRPPLHAMLWPLAMVTDFGLPTAPGQVLLIVSDPEDTPPGAVAWIARRFGLSPSEEKLADAVIAGVPLSEAATQLGIQLSTARTRFKAIQAKTGCHRQLDLVRLAMSVPAIRLR
jgi:DNA-binding CsgD family transcriptional regulator/PAS domain-containing protein